MEPGVCHASARYFVGAFIFISCDGATTFAVVLVLYLNIALILYKKGPLNTKD